MTDEHQRPGERNGEVHPCAIECQRREHKGYPRCVDANQCDHNGRTSVTSIADLIEEWFEGGTVEQKLDEAKAQIRKLESAASETEDSRRLDWLEDQAVEVRTPLVYGSRHLFYAKPDRRDGYEESSDIRKQIDAAMAAAPHTDVSKEKP